MEETTHIILANEFDQIRQVAPFDRLDQTTVEAVLTVSALVFHRHGSVIAHPEITEPEQRLWLVRQGAVLVTPLAAGSEGGDRQNRVASGLWPIECALQASRPLLVHTAIEDSFLWKIEGSALHRLLAEPAVLRWLAERWQESSERLREVAAGLASSRQIADQALALPARSAGSAIVCCIAADATIGEAAAQMANTRIGSLLVGSLDHPEGILTQTDLVRRGMAQALPPETPVSMVMSTNPAMIEESATVLEAGIEMARQGFRHLLIRNSEGRIAGVVSERDLFRIQQQGLVHVFRPISEATNVNDLVEVAGRVRELAERVFAQGMEVSQFTRLVSSINDRLAQRLLTLIMGENTPTRRFCWLAFGSEGREEQGFVTDQDNGLVFAPPADGNVEALRAAYLADAQRVNDALHACGFERCKGQIMAGNPAWCMTLDEWRRLFSKLISATTPTALLNATIFFDFRPIFGEHGLAESMRDHLIEAVKGKSIFLHLMAKNALEVAPPVGRLNRFSTASGTHKGTVDLKTQGSRLFVDIARIYALASGVRATNTEQRLRIAGQRIKRAPSAIEGDIAAFRFVQRIRLHRQLASLRDGRDANRVDPYLINEVEQRTLRESFRQAQSLQDRLRLDYQR